MNVSFLLYSILLDEEGHIKITGMWEKESFMPTNWFFWNSVYCMHPGLWLEGVCLQSLEARRVECWASLSFCHLPCCTAHGEHSIFLVKLCSWLMWSRQVWLPATVDGRMLLIWVFNSGRGWLGRHPFATLEPLSSQPFHSCNLGLLFLILWLAVQESSLALLSPNLNFIYLLIKTPFCFEPEPHSEQGKWHAYFQGVLTSTRQSSSPA